MKKRLFAILLIISLCIMSGCGKKNSSDKKPAENSTDSSVQNDNQNVDNTNDNDNNTPEETDKEDEVVEEPVIYEYMITLPEGYTATIEGEALDENGELVNSYNNEKYKNITEYIQLPVLNEYKITTIVERPSIKVYDSDGTEISVSVDSDGNILVDDIGKVKEMPQERIDASYAMVKTWGDFLTAELEGDGYGVDTVRQYLIRDSYYWKLATDYAYGPDITFISNHSSANNSYNDIVVDNYVEYSSECYSCRVAYNKTMLLTRTGNTCTDKIDMTVFFIYYDDTDDGVDNPHWGMIDMIASTSNGAGFNEQGEELFDENGIRVEEISGRCFKAKMMIIKDPSQVCVGSVSSGTSWPDTGKELLELVSEAGGIAGINGGIYNSTGNSGGQPLGVLVQNGQITYNAPSSLGGLYMIGMDNNNKLIIKDIEGMDSDDFSSYVSENGIRDAVAFQEETYDDSNHFVPLLVDGTVREINGYGSGANPRTAIGQREDGAILMLVTDGRGANGHLGATALDLVQIMQEYGAVNAANLDGGSSSTMVYNGAYAMTSVTFYYQNSSWRLPTAFMVKAKS